MLNPIAVEIPDDKTTCRAIPITPLSIVRRKVGGANRALVAVRDAHRLLVCAFFVDAGVWRLKSALGCWDGTRADNTPQYVAH